MFDAFDQLTLPRELLATAHAAINDVRRRCYVRPEDLELWLHRGYVRRTFLRGEDIAGGKILGVEVCVSTRVVDDGQLRVFDVVTMTYHPKWPIIGATS